MDLMGRPASGSEEPRAQAGGDELVERVARAVREDGTVETLEGLYLARSSSPTELGHGVSTPAFCVIAQGSKEILLGDELYRYDPNHYLITTAALPVAGRVTEASEERPYLGIVLGLDPALVGSVLVEVGHHAPRDHAAVRALDVSPLDAGLLDAVVRLVRLLDSPTEARYLAPLVTREIVYRLLIGEQGGRLRHTAALGGHAHRIGRALERLREDFDRPLRVKDLAREVGMSVSGFHHHFRAVTAMSPLQFQKRIRLQEARRLMLGEGLDAGSAILSGRSSSNHVMTPNFPGNRKCGAPRTRTGRSPEKASQANCIEPSQRELRRTHLLGSWVNSLGWSARCESPSKRSRELAKPFGGSSML